MDRRFLFGDELAEYLDALDKHMLDYHAANVVSQSQEGPDAEARSRANETEQREFAWLSEESKGGLQAKFAPYLRFDDVRR